MFRRVLNTPLYLEIKGLGKSLGPKLFSYTGTGNKIVKSNKPLAPDFQSVRGLLKLFSS